MAKLPWNNDAYKPDRLLEAAFIPAANIEYPDRPQSPSLKDMAPSTEASTTAEASKPAGRYVPPSARNRPGRGGPSLAERMRAEKEGKMKGAQKVADKPKAVVGATGKVIVGMAPPTQGKSKSALRREKAKQKKEEEEARKALEEKVAVEAKRDSGNAQSEAVDPEKRARKIKKTLKQIDDLRAKDPATLNDDQKKKIESEADLRKELASLNIQ